MIRNALPQHIPLILPLARECWETTIYKDDIDEKFVKDFLSHCIKNGITLIALDKKERMSGFLVAVIGPLIINPAIQCATEIAMWMSPSKRKGGGGLSLLRSFEKICDQKDIKYRHFTTIENDDTLRMTLIFNKLGYNINEKIFTKMRA